MTRADAVNTVIRARRAILDGGERPCAVGALEVKRAAARGQAHVDAGFWGGAVPGNLDDVARLHDAGVFGFKCFLADSGVREFPRSRPHEAEDRAIGQVIAAARDTGGRAHVLHLSGAPALAALQLGLPVVWSAARARGHTLADAGFDADPARLRHRNPVSPYAGRHLHGAVRQTWLAGTPIDPDGPATGRLPLREGRS